MTSLPIRLIGSPRRWPRLLAASAAVILAASACASPRTVRRPGAEPTVRIGVVVAGSEVRVASQGRVLVSPQGSADILLDGGEQITLVPQAGGIAIRDRSAARSFEQIRVRAGDRSQYVEVNGRPYRGGVEVYARNGAVYVVNELRLEAYLQGVVAREMGSRGEADRAALEAQAIVSRTYTLRNLGRFRAQGYDLQAGVADQAYGGVESESSVANAAVRATAGMVVTFGGRLISPFFHSTCGGSTAGPEEAFRSVQPVPYLTPVSDRRPGGYYCDIAPRFRWEVEWDGATLRDILRRTVPAVLGIDADRVDRVRGARVHRTGRSRRAAEVRLMVEGGEIPVYGPDIRRVFQTPEGQPLNSTAIALAAALNEGEVVRLTASGAGWGHGVGMCQWGAIGRARAGQDARTIVTTYFPGGRIERWY